MIKIDKGVPIPNGGGHNKKYPWIEMEVGDSFFIPGKTTTQISLSNPHRLYPGKRFMSATMNGGVRVWRVK